MKKRFSLMAVVGISAATAMAVAIMIAWTDGVKKVHSVDVREVVPAESQPDVRPASWFAMKPASFADLAEKVQGAVVNISTSKKVGMRGFMSPFPQFRQNDPFDDFFEKFFEGMPKDQERVQHSLGSGFIIDKNGTILTNNHVVSQADEIEVVLSDDTRYKAKVLGVDEKTDIAVIKIDADHDLPVAELGNSEEMRPGDWVMAIGNPFGLDHTVTVGVVSAKGRLIGGGPYAKFIQTDASINPGNSGGPLFNLKGQVIGINTMIVAGGQGIGFAIPIDLAKSMVPELVEKGTVSRGWLGVALQKITPELAKSFNLTQEKGALIAEVYSGSPAAKAGLMRGDVVVEYNGEKVDEPYDLSLLVGQTKPKSENRLVIIRDGERKEITVKVGKQEGAQAGTTGTVDELGLVVRTVSDDQRRNLGLPSNFNGVVVERVEPGSSAEQASVQAGDVILEINNAKINSIEDYEGVAKKLKKGDVVRLFIKRDKASIYLAFKL